MSYTPPLNSPYRSAQKLHRDNCLSEITSNATLKATTLANLGLTAAAAAADNTFHATVTLTPTQIKTMYTTPVTVLAAPAAGLTNMIDGPVTFKYIYGTAAYTSGGAIVIQYHTGPVAATGTVAGTQLGAASTTSVAYPIAALPALNDALEITNATGVFAGSTSTGTLTIDFNYRTV